MTEASSVSMPINTQTAAADGDAGSSHNTCTTGNNTEAAAAAIARNSPIMAFERTGPLWPKVSLWKAQPQAAGTVQALRMGSAARKHTVQSERRPPTPEPLSDADIRFKVMIWPFVVSFMCDVFWISLIIVARISKPNIFIPRILPRPLSSLHVILRWSTRN